MKCLLTGGDGFIGSNVLQYLLNNTKWEFTLISSFRHHGNPLNVPLSNRVNVVTMDLRGIIPDIGEFDYILNLASESHVDRSIVDPVGFIENNISSTLQVLEYARKHVPTRFIHFSTDEVYGANEHNDWDVLLPTNPYSASKAAQEMIVQGYYHTYKLPLIITNSNNVIGKNQHPEKFVPKIIDLIKNDKTVTLHIANGKYGRRYYNPVENVADALKFILKAPYYRNALLPRYSLLGGEVLDNFEMAQKVAKILGKELKYKEVEATKVRPGYDAFYEQGEDTLLVMGWKPPYTLDEGLQWIKSM